MAQGGARQRALEETQRFKASWVELGAVLSQVDGEALWQAWGFESFDKYCRRELQLRPETASKVVRSYAFLHAHTGADSPASPSTSAPPLDVVDLLSRAQSRGQLPDDAYQTVAAEVLGGACLSRGQVLRRLRQHDPQTLRAPGRAGAGSAAPCEDAPATAASARPAEPAAAHIDPQELRKTLALAARLAELCEGLGLGEQPTRHVQAVVRALRGLVGDAARSGAA